MGEKQVTCLLVAAQQAPLASGLLRSRCRRVAGRSQSVRVDDCQSLMGSVELFWSSHGRSWQNGERLERLGATLTEVLSGRSPHLRRSFLCWSFWRDPCEICWVDDEVRPCTCSHQLLFLTCVDCLFFAMWLGNLSCCCSVFPCQLDGNADQASFQRER